MWRAERKICHCSVPLRVRDKCLISSHIEARYRTHMMTSPHHTSKGKIRKCKGISPVYQMYTSSQYSVLSSGYGINYKPVLLCLGQDLYP